MKLSRKKSLIKTKKTASKSKKQFDLQEFRRSFESLDSDNYGSWPLPVKVTVIGLIITLIAALSWSIDYLKIVSGRYLDSTRKEIVSD